MTLTLTQQIRAARSAWRYRGQERPQFADEPEEGQISVWDFPRPPRIEALMTPFRVESDRKVIAETQSGVRVLETASAPTYYFPPSDVQEGLTTRTGKTFHCEWKGLSDEIALPGIKRAGWQLVRAYPEFADLIGWYAFYPQALDCFVGQEHVKPQPGGYYGGWVTKDLAGPIKGADGSSAW